MAAEDLLAPLITMVISFLITVTCILGFLFGYWLCSEAGSIRLGDGLPGAFDDSEEFRKEEEQALELMDERSRESYLAAKRWIEHNPPDSTNTDMSLSQYMTIQDAGVAAWEFPYDYQRPGISVLNKTEIEFQEVIGCLQTNLPLPKQNEVYYFETKIYELPADTRISVGLATKPYPQFRLPGMHRYSVAYESTGIRRLNQPFSAPKYGRKMLQGDVVGVGYRPRTGTVFFTHNGKKLEDVVQGMRINLFPTIGATGPCNLLVNLGQAGFVFIEANVKKWGFAAAQGTMAPPPAYGDQGDSVLLLPTVRTPPRRPPSFSSTNSAGADLEGAINMTPLPPPYPVGRSNRQDNNGGRSRDVPSNDDDNDDTPGSPQLTSSRHLEPVPEADTPLGSISSDIVPTESQSTAEISANHSNSPTRTSAPGSSAGDDEISANIWTNDIEATQTTAESTNTSDAAESNSADEASRAKTPHRQELSVPRPFRRALENALAEAQQDELLRRRP